MTYEDVMVKYKNKEISLVRSGYSLHCWDEEYYDGNGTQYLVTGNFSNDETEVEVIKEWYLE